MPGPLLLRPIRLLGDMGAQRLPVQSPRAFGAGAFIGQPVRHAGPIIHTAAADLKAPSGFGLATPAPDKFDDTFAQILTASHTIRITDGLLTVHISPGLAIYIPFAAFSFFYFVPASTFTRSLLPDS